MDPSRVQPIASSASASAPASAAPMVVLERPPAGLGRGLFAAPPWAIALLGGTVALVGLGWAVWRWWRARRPR